jgi:hypothetical protein
VIKPALKNILPEFTGKITVSFIFYRKISRKFNLEKDYMKNREKFSKGWEE